MRAWSGEGVTPLPSACVLSILGGNVIEDTSISQYSIFVNNYYETHTTHHKIDSAVQHSLWEHTSY